MLPSFPTAGTWTWWVGWGSIEMGLSGIALGGRDCGYMPDKFQPCAYLEYNEMNPSKLECAFPASQLRGLPLLSTYQPPPLEGDLATEMRRLAAPDELAAPYEVGCRVGGGARACEDDSRD